MSLVDQVSDLGVGFLPKQEIPTRPSTSTSKDKEDEFRMHRQSLMKALESKIKQNIGEGSSTSFCNDPRTLVTLSVLPVNHPKLYRRQYKIAQTLIPYVTAGLQDWLKRGKIKEAPAGCKFNSPLVIAPKYDKDGHIKGVRICIDSRQLNKYLIEDDRFEIPEIPQLLTKLSGAKIFGEFDLTEAYYQFKLTAESQPYTAFSWEGKQYMMVGVPYGIKFIPSFFQRYMNTLFSDMPFVFPYLDNITFVSKTWEEHLLHAGMILDRLNSVNLKLNPKDGINIGNSEIRILGHLISEKGIFIDPKKKEILLSWEKPSTGAGLASFLGLAVYASAHIRHFADITARLFQEKARTKNKNKINWTPELELDFNLVKKAIANAPFLRFYDPSKRIVLGTDMSQVAIGGVLYQPDDDNDTITSDNIVAFCSKKLSPTQQRYPAYKKELWAMVYCLRKFHQYIWGRRNVTVYTDHKPLIHILNQENLSVSLQQWLDVILDYDLNIRYRPGIHHVIPDALSRMYDAAYQNHNAIWGTIHNIKFNEVIDNVLSSSDIITIDSIESSAMSSKKHNKLNTNQANINLQFPSTISKIKSKLKIKNATKSPNDKLYVSSSSSKNEYVNENDNNEIHLNYLTQESMDDYITAEDQLDWDLSLYSIPLFQLSYHGILSNAPNSPYIIDKDDIEHDEIKENMPSSIVSSPLSTSSSISNTSSKSVSQEKIIDIKEKLGFRIPPINEREDILHREHNWGHFGQSAMLKSLLQQNIWWPTIRKDIEETVKLCSSCQQYTIRHTGYHPCRPIGAPLPGDRYMADLFFMPKSIDGKEACLIVKDVFSGFIVLIPLHDRTASTVAQELFKLFAIIGPPAVLQTDHGREFWNQVLEMLSKLQGWKHKFNTVQHSPANGQVERAIGSVRQSLNKSLFGDFSTWPIEALFTMMQYNDKISEVTGSKPFHLFFNRNMFSLIDNTTDPPTKIDINNYKEYQIKLIKLVFPEIYERAMAIRNNYAQRKDTHRHVIQEDLLPGTIVMLQDPQYINNPSTKPNSEPKFIGPYTIVKRIGKGGYVLQHADGSMEPQPRSIEHLRILFTPSQIPKDKLVHPDQHYRVDRLIGKRITEDGTVEYLVKWKGYNSTTWEPKHNIDDVNLIKKYDDIISERRPKRKAKTKAKEKITKGINHIDYSSKEMHLYDPYGSDDEFNY